MARKTNGLLPHKAPIDFIDEILEEVSRGATLNETCKRYRPKGGPPESRVRTWVLYDTPPGIAAKYARARELQLDSWADEIVRVSRTPLPAKTIEKDSESGITKTTVRDAVDRARLQIDTMKWVMCKLNRRKYGDDTTGPDAMRPKTVITLDPFQRKLVSTNGTNGEANGANGH